MRILSLRADFLLALLSCLHCVCFTSRPPSGSREMIAHHFVASPHSIQLSLSFKYSCHGMFLHMWEFWQSGVLPGLFTGNQLFSSNPTKARCPSSTDRLLTNFFFKGKHFLFNMHEHMKLPYSQFRLLQWFPNWWVGTRQPGNHFSLPL